MARSRFTTWKRESPKKRTLKRDVEPVADQKGPIAEAALQAENEPHLLPQDAAVASSSNSASEPKSTMMISHDNKKTKAPEIKKIILRMPTARHLYHMRILPVDVIMEDLTEQNGGIPPDLNEIRAEAVIWMKEPFKAGKRMVIIREAAKQILERLDEVICGNPAKPHSIPQGKGLARLELQRKFLHCILNIRCEVFDFMFAPNQV